MSDEDLEMISKLKKQAVKFKRYELAALLRDGEKMIVKYVRENKGNEVLKGLED